LYHDLACARSLSCSCPSVEEVGEFKYLGVTLDQRLNWKSHASNLKIQIRRNIRKFYFLRNICDQNLLKSLYYALIHSRLQYSLECWGGATADAIKSLITTQNYFLRIITSSSKFASSFPLYRQHNILPLRHLFIFKVLRMFYKRSGNSISHSVYNTRSAVKGNLKTPKVNLSWYTRSYLFLGPKIYNLLPDDLKNCSKIKVYTKNLKSWLFLYENINVLTNVLQ